jgi:hypothetical protein
MTGAEVRRALELLERVDWIKAEYETGIDGPIAVTPKPTALQLLRAWPIDARDTAIADALLVALDNAIEGASDPDEKTRLQKLRAASGDVGKSVLVGAIVAAGKAVAGG